MARGHEEQYPHRADRRKSDDEAVEQAKRKLIKAVGKLLPFGAQVVASIAAYNVGMTATQLFGFVCKISCATPVLGPCMGLVGVGFANALAGQASRHAHKLVRTGGNPLKPGFWEPPDLDDVVLDAVLGACIFKTLGGRFSSLMPSDLSKPGALAFESIPARTEHSEAYAKPSVKRELARIFKRDGCHHCGSTRGPVIGDHMPPNKLVDKDSLSRAMQDIPGVAKVRELIGLAGRTGKPLQRFYPQCQKCSIKQATAMRNGKRVLVLHLHAPRYRSEHLSGIFVGIRHNVPPVSFPPGFPDSRRRSVAKWANPLAITAAAPADEARADAEKSSSHTQHAGPQLLVQELIPTSWNIGMQAVVPAAAASNNHSQHQQSHHPYTGQPRQQSGFEHKLGRQGGQTLAGILVPQAGDVRQQQERDATGAPLMIPVLCDSYKQRADAAFEKHFTNQPTSR